MRVLFLCHRIPYPPDKGDKIRAFHALKALASRHDVDVFTLADDPRDLQHRDVLASMCRGVTVAQLRPTAARLRSLRYMPTRLPLTVPYFYSASLHSELAAALVRHRYERIFVYCSAMNQYIAWNTAPMRRAAAAGGRQIPVITDLVDIDSDKWRQYASATRFPFSWLYAREWRALQAYESRIARDSACVIVSTEREAQLARQLAPSSRVHVVSNGVDAEHFAPASESVSADPPAVIFTGDMAYFPNQDAAVFFAIEVLPLVRRRVAAARFLVVGRNPNRRVERLREIPGVEVTGWVPDVRPWLNRARVAVAPLRIAAGVQNKVLEAMAAGLPVVATERVVHGLSRRVAEMVDTAESPSELAEKVVRLLENRASAEARGREGRQRVIGDYSWGAAYRRYLALIDEPNRPALSDDPVPGMRAVSFA